MKIIVIGLGSMGRRRCRLIKKIDKDIEIAGVDLSKDRQKQAKEELEIETFSNLKEAQSKLCAQCAFVCVSPIYHKDIVFEALELGLNIFTEINLLSDWYDEAIKKAKEKNLKLFISSTPKYRKEIKFIQSKIKNSEKYNYTYHVGQYLPDWHPWESYKNFFVSNPKTNGCREIFAIQLPWLTDTFGEIEQVSVLKDKISNLELDYPDNYIVSIKHKNGNKGVFAVDVVARHATSDLTIYNENLYLKWNGKPDGIELYDFDTKEMKIVAVYETIEQNKNYASNIIENAYSDEIKNFFDYTNEVAKPLHTFEKDMEILNVIDKIEGIQ